MPRFYSSWFPSKILNASVLSKFVGLVGQKTPVCLTKCPTKIFRPKKKYRARKLVIHEKWRRPWQNKNKRKEKQIRRWNKLKTKQNTKQTAQSGHSNTAVKAGHGWHLKIAQLRDRDLRLARLLKTKIMSIRIESIMSFRMILVIVCH